MVIYDCTSFDVKLRNFTKFYVKLPNYYDFRSGIVEKFEINFK